MTDDRLPPPEEALAEATRLHHEARALDEQAFELRSRRNMAVRVAVAMGRASCSDVASALGVTTTQVRHILQGNRGGRHLSVVDFQLREAERRAVEFDLDGKWPSHPIG